MVSMYGIRCLLTFRVPQREPYDRNIAHAPVNGGKGQWRGQWRGLHARGDKGRGLCRGPCRKLGHPARVCHLAHMTQLTNVGPRPFGSDADIASSEAKAIRGEVRF